MENKNVFIAIALSMSVLLFWSAFFPAPQPIENQKVLNVNFDPSVVDDATVKMIAKISNQFAPVGRILNTKFKT